ncbi:MAG TPA: methyl-accepting chemotaxis protein [Lachnospiraceae bacterium]|nr:methyl-accepting chemotaxis protein [Lachnospiraceae bacterium]HPF29950.1 methyl-accepting chemotaxis protein [Lachnospiraceae bacterium]
MQEKLAQVAETLCLVNQLTSQKMLIELYDESLTLVFCDAPDGIPQRHRIGEAAIQEREIAMNAMQSGEEQHDNITDADGQLWENSCVPLFDNSAAVGCIVTAYPKRSNEVAMQKAEIFMDAIDRITNSIDMMTIHFENLFDRLQGMKDKTGSIGKGVEETSNVVSKIKANASKSKILALNASIEAARSGEAGRGFTVVAKEMGEMATASGTSAVEINTALKSIFGDLDEIVDSITDANELAEKQTSSIKEIEECLGAACQAAMELGEVLQNQ